jgi:apolipoprotein N-acyltransferase
MAVKIKKVLGAGVLLLIIWALVLTAASCGRKKWPSPQTQKETFSWELVQAQRDQECLQITAGLQGKSSNLRNVVLQLEGSQEPCPQCPFQPQQSIPIEAFSSGVQKKNGQIKIEYCELDPGLTYRLRLVGQNAFPGLQPAASQVIKPKHQ